MLRIRDMAEAAKHIIFKGRVQGVGFRFTVLNTASRYRLTGYVRNASDGTVEMLAQGPAADIDDCINHIKQSFADYVSETKSEDVPANRKYTDFKITF